MQIARYTGNFSDVQCSRVVDVRLHSLFDVACFELQCPLLIIEYNT